MLELGLKLLLAYWLGSISGSLVVGRLFGGIDIRTEGSGNAGGTNALRTHGFAFALPVVIIDVGKGALAAWLVPKLNIVGTDPALARDWLAVGCSAAAVVGHIWPFWHGFRGGKGAGTLIGAYAVLAPQALLAIIGVWLLSVVATGYVGLSTMLAASAAALACAVWFPERTALIAFALAMAALIVYAHRSNVARMRAGVENRMEKMMFWRRGDRP